MPDIFLSYSREDQAVARQYADAFHLAGLDVWWDTALRSGEAYDEVTEAALRAAEVVVVLWSRKSVQSRWVRAEATQGQRSGVLLPCMIEDCERPVMFELTQTADLAHWDGDPKDKKWQVFLADVRHALAISATADRSQRANTKITPASIAGLIRRRVRRHMFLVLGSLAAIAATTVVVHYWARPRPTGVHATPRLAVLRLENISDTEPYFSEGVADELISEAGRIQGMEVSGRASSFALTGERATPANAAKELGATLVLTGSVRRLPDKVRVNAELVEAPGGKSLWRQTFERPASEVFQLERDIAIRVAQAADARVTAPLSRQVDAEAYNLYLQGREKQLGVAQSDWRKVRDLYRSAVDRDPRFAAAWAALARAEANLASDTLDTSASGAFTEESLAPAFDAAAKAIALDGTLAEPYAVRMIAQGWLGHWKLASDAAHETEQRGGFAGNFYRAVGYMQKAEDARRRSTTLDPLSATEWNNYAYTCEYNAHADCQLEAAQRAHDLAPHDTAVIRGLVRALNANDRGKEALELMKSEKWLDGPSVATRTLMAMAGDGDGPKTADMLAALKRHDSYVDTTIGNLADLKRWDDAAKVLEQWGPSERSTIFALFRAQWAPLRKTPQFWAIMEREGLVEFWKQSGQWPDFCVHEPVCEAHKGS